MKKLTVPLMLLSLVTYGCSKPASTPKATATHATETKHVTESHTTGKLLPATDGKMADTDKAAPHTVLKPVTETTKAAAPAEAGTKAATPAATKPAAAKPTDLKAPEAKPAAATPTTATKPADGGAAIPPAKANAAKDSGALNRVKPGVVDPAPPDNEEESGRVPDNQ